MIRYRVRSAIINAINRISGVALGRGRLYNCSIQYYLQQVFTEYLFTEKRRREQEIEIKRERERERERERPRETL